MPNWCYQNLEVRGPTSDVDKFYEAIKVTEPDREGAMVTSDELNHICPLDERTFAYKTMTNAEGEEYIIKTYATLEENGFDGYKHAVEVWGTKWGACHIEVRSEQGECPLHIYFESAWSPASGLIKAISTKFPTLVFGLQFTEEADFYSGYQLFQNGEIRYEGDTGQADTKDAEAWLVTQQELAKTNPEIKEDEMYDQYYEMVSKATELRNELLENKYEKAMSSFSKFYTAKPPKQMARR